MNDTEKFVITRLDKIDEKIDRLMQKLDERIVPLEKFQYKLLGMAALVAFIISIIPPIIGYAKS